MSLARLAAAFPDADEAPDDWEPTEGPGSGDDKYGPRPGTESVTADEAPATAPETPAVPVPAPTVRKPAGRALSPSLVCTMPSGATLAQPCPPDPDEVLRWWGRLAPFAPTGAWSYRDA